MILKEWNRYFHAVNAIVIQKLIYNLNVVIIFVYRAWPTQSYRWFKMIHFLKQMRQANNNSNVL